MKKRKEVTSLIPGEKYWWNTLNGSFPKEIVICTSKEYFVDLADPHNVYNVYRDQEFFTELNAIERLFYGVDL